MTILHVHFEIFPLFTLKLLNGLAQILQSARIRNYASQAHFNTSVLPGRRDRSNPSRSTTPYDRQPALRELAITGQASPSQVMSGASSPIKFTHEPATRPTQPSHPPSRRTVRGPPFRDG